MMLGCISAAAVFAAAFAVDLKSGFESDPFAGGHLMADDFDPSLSFVLNPSYPGSHVALEGDVVVDGKMRFTATDDDSVPSLPDGSKFALWLYGSGGVTNLRVTAAGNTTRTAATYIATNYCLAVSSDELYAGEWCRVTVRAIPSITTQPGERSLMGFVVFINGKPAACADPDYRRRFPDLPFNEVAEALIDLKLLYPSIRRSGYSVDSGRLASLDFVGNMHLDELSVGYAADKEPLGALPVPVEDGTTPHFGRTLYATPSAAESAIGLGLVAWPDDAELPASVKTPANQLRYSRLFNMMTSGRTVLIGLKDNGEEVAEVENAISAATASIKTERLAAGETASVEVDAVPGLYYGVSTGETLDAMEVKSWTIATEDTVEVSIPAKDENQVSGFYRLEASPHK
ncbi:MAG: hypothetical protein II823_05110 [Kiritimatiellae bacterium]|nr:hypothetical protein [Kiritimatiellia bacterium]